LSVSRRRGLFMRPVDLAGRDRWPSRTWSPAKEKSVSRRPGGRLDWISHDVRAALSINDLGSAAFFMRPWDRWRPGGRVTLFLLQPARPSVSLVFSRCNRAALSVTSGSAAFFVSRGPADRPGHRPGRRRLGQTQINPHCSLFGAREPSRPAFFVRGAPILVSCQRTH
jgi:hypothetical protein